MYDFDSKNLKCVLKFSIAKRLIQEGYIVRDIKPNKNNNESTVFLFDNIPEIVGKIIQYSRL